MAKQRGPVASTFSGRVGNVVGAKLKGGEYVTRSYQPSVKNPNTKRQQVSRGKMSVASKLAAILSAAIKTGYAAASSSSKMYPRNMFVKDVIPVENGMLIISGDAINWEPSNIKVSHAIGISVVPEVTLTGEIGQTVTISAQNASSVPLGMGENLGMVVTMIENDGEHLDIAAITKQGLASAGVEFSATEMAGYVNPAFYVFYKVIPAAKNGVVSTEEPWMYPSETSATTFFSV